MMKERTPERICLQVEEDFVLQTQINLWSKAKHAGLTKKDLAQLVDVTVPTVRTMFGHGGQLSLRRIARIAHKLGYVPEIRLRKVEHHGPTNYRVSRPSDVADRMDAASRSKQRSVAGLRRDLESYDLDERYENRLSELQCRYCYYIHTAIVGHMFTEQQCIHCNKEFSHSNTQKLKYCIPCAKDLHVCRYCESDLDTV